MGMYEQWNPLFFQVRTDVPESIDRLSAAVNSCFSQRGLPIGNLRDQPAERPAWLATDASFSYSAGGEIDPKDFQKFNKTVANDEAVLNYLTGYSRFPFFGGGGPSISEIQDDKLVLSFTASRVDGEVLDRLVDMYVDFGLAHGRNYVAVDRGMANPHNYMTADISIDDNRQATRIVGVSQYQRPHADAIWISSPKSSAPFGQRDEYLIEFRMGPQQSFMKVAQAAVELGSIVSDKPYDRKEAFLDVWHSAIHDLISPELSGYTRTPTQERIFHSILTHTVLPYFDESYANANGFSPYNSMVFGARGVGKSLLAAMFATTRFDGGVVVPVSQDMLTDASLFNMLGRYSSRTGVKFIPLMEDVDKIASTPSKVGGIRGSVAQTVTHADISNLLAGMGSNRPVLIGTGNDPEDMDPNMLEPERLGGNIHHLTLPNAAERRLLVGNLLEGREYDGDIADHIVAGTDGFSHRMIHDVVKRCVPLSAETRIGSGEPTGDDFQDVVERSNDMIVRRAIAYGTDRYLFSDLNERENRIKDFLEKKLGKQAN